MSSKEWIEYPFTQIIDFQEGPGILAKDFRESGIPLIRLSGLNKGTSLLNGCNYLDPKLVERRYPHFRIKKGDILLSTSASLGRTAVVDESAEGAIVYTGLIRMRPKDNKIFAPFIKFLLESPDFQQQIEAMGAGSVIRHFGPYHLKQMTVTIPSLPAQRRIADILSALDEKIELNRQVNATLEGISQAVFKEWFIDFHFPNATGEMVESELGMIPNGWQVGRLEDIVEVKGGTTPSTKEEKYWNGEYHFVTPKDLSNLSSPVLLNTERKITKDGVSQISSGILPVGTLLLSSRAPIGYLAITTMPISINQGFIAINAKETSNLFMLYWLKENMETIISRANGSTFLEINKTNFREIELVVPDAKIAKLFERTVSPIFEQIKNNEQQSATLMSVRDMLLPRLMSGEIDL